MNRIEFPNIGLKFPFDNVAFNVFGVEIYWYGIIISLGFIIAVVLAMRNSKKFGIEPDNVIDLVLFAAPIAIVGARIYYVVFNWSEFNGDISKIINIRQGGLAIYGGIIAAVIVTCVFAKVKGINLLKLLDLGAPYLVLAQAIGRWGNFVNQEAFGTNTDLPWGMTGDLIREELYRMRKAGIDVNPDMLVHPTFLYESLWNLGVFLFLLWFGKRKKMRGEVFFLYMILYGIGRSWIEGLRTDSLMLGSVRISQILSLLFAVFFTVLLLVRRKKSLEYQEEMGQTSDYAVVLKKIKGAGDKEEEPGTSRDDAVSGCDLDADVAGDADEEELGDNEVEADRKET